MTTPNDQAYVDMRLILDTWRRNDPVEMDNINYTAFNTKYPNFPVPVNEETIHHLGMCLNDYNGTPTERTALLLQAIRYFGERRKLTDAEDEVLKPVFTTFLQLNNRYSWQYRYLSPSEYDEYVKCVYTDAPAHKNRIYALENTNKRLMRERDECKSALPTPCPSNSSHIYMILMYVAFGLLAATIVGGVYGYTRLKKSARTT